MHSEISVIVPVYNVEHYLQRCINSIIQQSYTHLEIILVDDGSTDFSGRICDLYKKRDKRIKVIHQPNSGLSEARNTGIHAATGEYIGFVDSDDFIHPDMYLSLYQMMEENNSDVAEAGFEKVYGNAPVLREAGGGNVTVYSGHQAAVSGIVNLRCTTYSWNKLYKRQLWDQITFPKGKIFEDEFTTYKVFHACNRVAVTDQKLYYYVQRKSSIAHSQFSLKMLDHCEALDEMIRFIEKNNPEALPIVSIKYMFSNIWHLHSLMVHRKNIPDAMMVINRRVREILSCSKYLGRKRNLSEATKRILGDHYSSLYDQRRKIIILLFLLRRSLYFFFITLSCRDFAKRHLTLQRGKLST
ncbi:glycosyltransferase [Sporolactobacillus shoreae]|uniref:Glycosyltransferase n=1 Tax=Sporolactobacillus shoreae TaxID=1465501 RepID=A0A4Z0GUM0_9BACL|nr:glycosyltransferase [Sporolactobacillus shoreae]TGA99958.1 glycosyltransferase [Sporolactobacillus shoreae]